MADSTNSRSLPRPAKGEIERQRRRQLREDKVRDRRRQEELAIAASEAAPQEEESDQVQTETGIEPEATERRQRRQRREEQSSTYQPFTEEMPETEDQSEKKRDQSAQPQQAPRDSVSDRIRQLRQSKGGADAVARAQQGGTSIREGVQLARAAQNLGSVAGRAAARAAVQGVVAFLNIPIGPLPLWAWLLIVLGVIVLIMAIWVGIVVAAGVVCEDPRLGLLPDSIKNLVAQAWAGIPCPNGT